MISYQFRGEKPLVAFLHLSEALAAVNRTVLTGTERNLAGLAAVGAYSVKHLSLGAGIVLAGISALSASLRLVLEALLCIELLLTSGEYELLAALFAYQCLVCVLAFTSLEENGFYPGETKKVNFLNMPWVDLLQAFLYKKDSKNKALRKCPAHTGSASARRSFCLARPRARSTDFTVRPRRPAISA